MISRRTLVIPSGLALVAALLGVFVGPAYSQSGGGSVGSIGFISTSSAVDGNGNRVYQVMLGGNFGSTSFTLSEKEYHAAMGDPNDGLSMRTDTALLEKYYSAHVQKTFGATDEEWKVLAPKLRLIQSLTWQLASHGRSGRGKGDAMTNLEKAWGALSSALKNKEAKLEEIKKLLQVVHDEEAKTLSELAKVRKELRDILTLRQEAMVVQMGILE
jgi:hypothetical protein